MKGHDHGAHCATYSNSVSDQLLLDGVCKPRLTEPISQGRHRRRATTQTLAPADGAPHRGRRAQHVDARTTTALSAPHRDGAAARAPARAADARASVLARHAARGGTPPQGTPATGGRRGRRRPREVGPTLPTAGARCRPRRRPPPQAPPPMLVGARRASTEPASLVFDSPRCLCCQSRVVVVKVLLPTPSVLLPGLAPPAYLPPAPPRRGAPTPSRGRLGPQAPRAPQTSTHQALPAAAPRATACPRRPLLSPLGTPLSRCRQRLLISSVTGDDCPGRPWHPWGHYRCATVS